MALIAGAMPLPLFLRLQTFGSTDGLLSEQHKDRTLRRTLCDALCGEIARRIAGSAPVDDLI